MNVLFFRVSTFCLLLFALFVLAPAEWTRAQCVDKFRKLRRKGWYNVGNA